MVTYSTNWMGPINEDWIKENGDCWCAGRIDIRDDTKEGYDGWGEYSVPPMKQTSWNLFGDWLDELETEKVVGYYRLVEMYETQTRQKIEWFKESE